MTLQDHIKLYTQKAQSLISIDTMEATDVLGKNISYLDAFIELIKIIRVTQDFGQMVYLIGNGGSAGIASENANRLRKYCKIRTMSFNDPITMSASANDSPLGWPGVFVEPLQAYIKTGHVLIAISSSGNSPNIINAVATARQVNALVVTLSGFDAENHLRKLGNLNFYIPSSDYQLVEGAHSHILGSVTNTLIKISQHEIVLKEI